MPDPIKSPENNDPNIPKKVIRTYSSDLATSVKEKGGEAFRIARVEQGIKEREAKIMAKQSKRNLLFGLGGLFFIIAALGVAVYFSSKSNVKLNPEPGIAIRPIIFFDNQFKIDISGMDKDKIVTAFKKETLESKIPAGDIESITFTENGNMTGLARLLNLLEIKLPLGMASYLDNDYFAGLFSDGTANWPFIILRTNSYADISPAIIHWEDHMMDDLAPILGIQTAGENNYLLQSKFESLIVSNKETRAIKGKDGSVVLMYLYLDEKNIMIARNKGTLDEVLLRLYSPKK